MTVRHARRLGVHRCLVVDGVRLAVDGQVMPGLLLPASASRAWR